jgi:hypothetical protein
MEQIPFRRDFHKMIHGFNMPSPRIFPFLTFINAGEMISAYLSLRSIRIRGVAGATKPDAGGTLAAWTNGGDG